MIFVETLKSKKSKLQVNFLKLIHSLIDKSRNLVYASLDKSRNPVYAPG